MEETVEFVRLVANTARFLTAASPSRQCRSLRSYMRANSDSLPRSLHLKSPLDVVVLTVARLSSLSLPLFPRLARRPFLFSLFSLSSRCLLQYATKDWYGGCSSERDSGGGDGS